ncbi:PEP-CTERM sorting domain-containing protein [Dapis sp. BLCC M126]
MKNRLQQAIVQAIVLVGATFSFPLQSAHSAALNTTTIEYENDYKLVVEWAGSEGSGLDGMIHDSELELYNAKLLDSNGNVVVDDVGLLNPEFLEVEENRWILNSGEIEWKTSDFWNMHYDSSPSENLRNEIGTILGAPLLPKSEISLHSSSLSTSTTSVFLLDGTLSVLLEVVYEPDGEFLGPHGEYFGPIYDVLLQISVTGEVYDPTSVSPAESQEGSNAIAQGTDMGQPIALLQAGAGATAGGETAGFLGSGETEGLATGATGADQQQQTPPAAATTPEPSTIFGFITLSGLMLAGRINTRKAKTSQKA